MDEEPKTRASGRMNRRDLLRRGAIVGGSLLWVAPVVQSLSPRAAASTAGSPVFGCCECRNGPPGKEICNTGLDNKTCTTTGSGQPPGSGPASSTTDCQSYCASQGQAFCFHSAATPLSCAPATHDRSFCTGD